MAADVEARGGRALISGINVTPLVDVLLVLLVVSMVTASEVARLSIALDLPEAATGQAMEGALAIQIDRGGAIALEGETVSVAALRERARTAGGAAARATIAADGETPHRAVVDVLDALRSEGISRYALVIQPARR
jgi:biopolymer transport protein ExbD